MIGEEDLTGRSADIEKTYVHDAYELMSTLQYPDYRSTAPWPKVKNFINEIEPGSIVCDVGCGSGKYLKVNPSVFKIGSDRCQKLTQMAKDDENEVLICDNLTLPFRDESFDAVLSIAVIHHFANKERRIRALRELARILRIGGKLMITVWAMEQKDRQFQSQDVLVQWHQPQFFQDPTIEFSTTATATSEEDFPLNFQQLATHEHESPTRSDSSKQDSSKQGRSRLRLFESLKTNITKYPSSSSLSSPNETCYSFVRKALMRFSSKSSKKEKELASRPWILESSGMHDDHIPATRYDPEGCEEDSEMQNIPIELISMDKEKDEPQPQKSVPLIQQLLDVTLPQKSKSLNDILKLSQPAVPITRSSSSTVTDADKVKVASIEKDSLKPKLVKQKKSMCEEDIMDEERDQPTDMTKIELPMFKMSMERPERHNVLKQKSLTEDIMSAERLKERDKVRQNIQKQASLNENLIFRRQRTSDSLKESFLSSSTKKLQQLRSSLSKLKSSTSSIEKVTGASIKSGFVKIFHGLTGGEPPPPSPPAPPAAVPLRKSSSEDRSDESLERRRSHEENSDSSKDNSLQSDTSVDSEDSIISVIERVLPRDLTSPTPSSAIMSPVPHSPKLTPHVLAGVLSHPSSPKIAKVIQYPVKAKALSLPASPRTIVFSPSIKQTFKIPPVAQVSTNGDGTVITTNGKIIKSDGNAALLVLEKQSNGAALKSDEPILKLSSMKQVTAARLKSFNEKEMKLLSEKLTELSVKQTEPRGDVCEGDDSRKSDTEQTVIAPDVKEDQPKPVVPATQSPFSPLRKVFQTSGVLGSQVTEKGDIFNPEFDDIDTDSSGVSTPDSVGSVISVRSLNGTSPLDTEFPTDPLELPEPESSTSTSESLKHSVEPSAPTDTHKRLLQVAVNVAESIEETVLRYTPMNIEHKLLEEILEESEESNHESSPSSSKGPKPLTPTEKLLRKYPALSKSPEGESWDKKYRQCLVDFAENLSEKLVAEIDRYKSAEEAYTMPATDQEDDPYLTKLSEELQNVSKLTRELSQDLIPEKEAEESEVKAEFPLKRELSADIDSPGSISGWLDSRRNTIETSGLWQMEQKADDEQKDEPRRLSIQADVPRKLSKSESTAQTRLSVESTDTVDISDRTMSSSEDSKRDTIQTLTSSGLSVESDLEIEKPTKTYSSQLSLRPGESIESSDACDISAGSDFSRQNTESRSVITQSSASLASWSECSKDIRFADRRTARCDGRSSSEETNRGVLTRQKAALAEAEVKEDTISDSTSQDSLTSESGGGNITYHRYYHVFRQGELDGLIEEFAENLHIISSFYDHSNWCVIAEKVQVWTI